MREGSTLKTAEGAQVNKHSALFLLLIVGVFNFVDRQIVGVLAVPIKADLGLNDTELGLMGGLAFALFYASMGIPIALLSDRFSRTWIITICLMVWSAMTALCGLAHSFWHLFLARVGVGVGEAGSAPATYSLISDYFPSEQRARALGAYSFCIPIGSAVGVVSGGIIATNIDWRAAFLGVGLLGLLFAPVFRFLVREPLRGRYDQVAAAPSSVSFKATVRMLFSKRSFWLLSLGAAFATMVAYGLFFWLPSFFVRSYGLSLMEASLAFGGLLVLGGIPGIWFGGYLVDRLGKTHKRAYATIPAMAFFVTIPLYAFGVLAPTFDLLFLLMLIPIALGLAWVGPVISAIQHIVKPHMRAMASAVMLLITNLVGLGIGTVLMGYISDNFQSQFGANSLRYSILAASVFYLLGGTFFMLAAKRLEQDWES